MRTGPIALAVFAALTWSAPALAQATTPVPKPSPFPGTGGTPPPAGAKPAAPRTTPVVAAQDGSALDPRLTGVPIYPGSQLLSSFDAGRGQSVFLFGTDMPYSDVVAYYKNQLRSSGSEIFRAPLLHQFDLATFRAETMSYRPSVVVKDYTGAETKGYLHVSGTTEKRFQTVIQVVPTGKIP